VLWSNYADLVSIHTLVPAAQGILQDVASQTSTYAESGEKISLLGVFV